VPPLPSVPKVIRVDQLFDIGADLSALTRFFIQFAGVNPSDAELVTFATVINGFAAADFPAYLHPDNAVSTTECTDLTSPVGAYGLFTAHTVGSSAGAPLPADTAFVSSYEIARRYRGGHPRGYWPFGASGYLVTPQLWDPTSVADFLAAVNAFFASVVGAGWSLAGTLLHVNVSYFSGFTVVVNPVTGRARNVPTKRASPLIDPVLTVVGRGRVGSQRRRLGRD
jgi:hypothetical protein